MFFRFFFSLTWQHSEFYFVEHVDETQMLNEDRSDTSVAAWVWHWATPRLVQKWRALGPQWASGQRQTCSASRLHQWSVWEEERNGEESLFILMIVPVFSSVLPTILYCMRGRCALIYIKARCVCVCMCVFWHHWYLAPVSLCLSSFCASHPPLPIIYAVILYFWVGWVPWMLVDVKIP